MKIAEEDPAQVHATLVLQREMRSHANLMEQTRNLFQRVGVAKLRTIKYASRLASGGHPVHPHLQEREDLGPLVGYLDTTTYSASHEKLVEYLEAIVSLRYDLQRHQSVLTEGLCVREAQETQEAIDLLAQAHKWSTKDHPTDTDAQVQLAHIRVPGNRAYKSVERVVNEMAQYAAQQAQIEQRLAGACASAARKRRSGDASSSQDS